MSSIITDYELLNSYSSLNLTEKVKEFLVKGYQPHGNAFMVRVDGECVFYQAVVKYDFPAIPSDTHAGPIADTHWMNV